MVQHSCWWILEQHHIGSRYSGITNNTAESLNAVLQRNTTGTTGLHIKKRTMDRIAVALTRLNAHYIDEVARAFHGVGDWQLALNFQDLREDNPNFMAPSGRKALTVEDIERLLDTEVGDLEKELLQPCRQMDQGVQSDNVEPERGDKSIICWPAEGEDKTLTSLEMEALAAIKEGRVSLCAQQRCLVVTCGQFVTKKPGAVRGVETRWSVTLNPLYCPCPSAGTCYHIIAALISLNLYDRNQSIGSGNLTYLTRNSRRQATKRCGKKTPSKHDTSDLSSMTSPKPGRSSRRQSTPSSLTRRKRESPSTSTPTTPRPILKSTINSEKSPPPESPLVKRRRVHFGHSSSRNLTSLELTMALSMN